MEYFLYHPFLITEPHAKFSDTWEDFCRRLLNLEHNTNLIKRRTPPDFGADLIWDGAGIIYQCKSSVDGQPGSLNTHKAIASIKQVLAHQTELQWHTCYLCTNVDVTGPQAQKLRSVLPTLQFLEWGDWIKLCHKFPQHINDRFRQLIPISPQSVAKVSNQAYLRTYLQQFREYTNTQHITLLVCSQRYQDIFELPVSPDFTINNVLHIVRELFNLPGPTVYEDLQTTMSLSYELHIDGQQLPSHLYLRDIITTDRPLVTLLKLMSVRVDSLYTESYTIENNFPTNLPLYSQQPDSTPAHLEATKRYEQKVQLALDNAVSHFLHAQNSQNS